MKKIVKPTILLVVLIMMLSTLTGCKTLDNMRDTHAVWTTKGVYDSITLNGVEYKKVAVDNPTLPLPSYDVSVLVTEPDVPVLLASSMCVTLNTSFDDNFIYGHLYNDPYIEYNSSGIFSDINYEEERREYVLFCKADIYDDVMKEIENGIEYTDYAYEYRDPETYESTYVFLTDEENEAINKIIKDVKPKDAEESVYTYPLSTLYTISEDHNFLRDSYEVFYDEYDNKYSLHVFSETKDKWVIYEVPDEMTEMFDKITQNSRSKG